MRIYFYLGLAHAGPLTFLRRMLGPDTPPESPTCPMIRGQFENIVNQVGERDANSPVSPIPVDPTLFEAGDLGTLILGKHIAKKRAASLFLAARQTTDDIPVFDLVVKHMHNCRDLSEEEEKRAEAGLADVAWNFLNEKIFGNEPDQPLPSLVREYAISKVLHDMQLVPNVGFVSALQPLTDNRWGFKKMSPEMLEECKKLGASVRTIVEDRAGVSVEEYVWKIRQGVIKRRHAKDKFASTRFLLELIDIAAETFTLLDLTQLAGVVHGDIHAGNVAVRKFTSPKQRLANDRFVDTSRSLILLDLGMSAFICDAPADLKTDEHASRVLASPWQLSGEGIRGFRDDAYRALEMFANHFSFNQVRSLENYLEDNLLESMKGGPFERLSRADVRDEFRKFKELFSFFTKLANFSWRNLHFRPVVYEPYREYWEMDKKIIHFLEAHFTCMLEYVKAVPKFDSLVNYQFLTNLLAQAKRALEESLNHRVSALADRPRIRDCRKGSVIFSNPVPFVKSAKFPRIFEHLSG